MINEQGDPLQFLTEFIENNGWYALKQEFIPQENDPYYDYYDPNTETVTIRYQTECGYETESYAFATKLQKYFEDKMQNDVRIKINNYLAYTKDDEQRRRNFDWIIRQLEHFQKLTLTKKELKKYINLFKLENFINKLKLRHETTKIESYENIQLAINTLENFGNAVKKITQNRRSDRAAFAINDEYDVQDLLYVVLKSIFPKLICEDAIPIYGSQSSKIDLMLREEGILLEVKILKNKSDENKVIKQLKVDFESYHVCQWLKTLICFIYDPNNLVKDKQHFMALEGKRTKNEHNFDVKVVFQS